MTPSERIMRYFTYAHLPERLQAISKPFADLAQSLDTLIPDGAEKTTMLRKLVEAKDCAVRAFLFDTPDNT